MGDPKKCTIGTSSMGLSTGGFFPASTFVTLGAIVVIPIFFLLLLTLAPAPHLLALLPPLFD